MIDSFRQNLIDYVLSGHAYLHAHTPEKQRFISELKEIAAELPPEGRPVLVWSPATAWQDAEGNPPKQPAEPTWARQTRRLRRSRSWSYQRRQYSCSRTSATISTAEPSATLISSLPG